MSPLVSVIIPNYNHAKYLKRRIESVLNQTFQDFEVIILDDCSKDDSKLVIEEYRLHPKVSQIIYNKENSGLIFRQWNKGFDLAKGKFIWIAESDDYAHETFLETLIKPFDDEKIGIVYCSSFFVDDENRITSKGSIHEHWQSNYRNNGLKEINDFYTLDYCPIPNVSSALLRKDVIVNIGKAPENFKRAGDWMFYINILKVSDIYFFNQPLNYFRFHPLKKKMNLDAHLYLFDRFRIYYSLKKDEFTKDNNLESNIRYMYIEYTNLLVSDSKNLQLHLGIHFQIFKYLIFKNPFLVIKCMVNAFKIRIA